MGKRKANEVINEKQPSKKIKAQDGNGVIATTEKTKSKKQKQTETPVVDTSIPEYTPIVTKSENEKINKEKQSQKKKAKKEKEDKTQTQQDQSQGAATPKETSEPKKKSKKSKNDGANNTNGNGEDTKSVPVTTEEPKKVEEKTLPVEATSGSFLTTTKFEDMGLSDKTMQGLNDMGLTRASQIQEKSIPPLLTGVDLLGQAKTGSGKTLAFLIPAVEMMMKAKFMPRNGVGVLIISPTRELALQIYGVACELMKYHSQTHAIIIGGTTRKDEVPKLQKGVNLLVSTPGRLLDHLLNTKFVYKNLQCLIIDEADRILEIGFEEEMHQILKLLPKERQTMLFSATQTSKVTEIAKLSLRGKPVYVGVEDKESTSTASNLEQGYVVCPESHRFLLLFTFLKKNLNKKVMVFFSSCKSVKFHAELFNYIDIPVLSLHGKQKQQKRTATFFQFINAKSGILLSTDVAARGLDIPEVDWIIQYDPPDDPKEYIHRVGRTARAGGKGKALLFLLPSELGFLRYLKHAKVPLNEYEFPLKKIANIQPQLEKLVETNFALNKSAKDAYRTYIMAYDAHSLKKIFNVHNLELQNVAKSFGFQNPPKVDLSQVGKVHTKKDKKLDLKDWKKSYDN